MYDSTVFVIGAGASNEAGLPLASGLVEKISQKLAFRVERGHLQSDSGDREILDAFNIIRPPHGDINYLLKAAAQVREGAPYANSIDTFMDNHVENGEIQTCAKLAIVKSIVEAETASTLYSDRNNRQFRDERAIRSSWYGVLFAHLSDGVRREEIGRIFERVRFIVFNYDRCLEHFLFNALQIHYGIDRRTAVDVMATLDVVHPYGVIAPLRWQDDREGIDFGESVSGIDLQAMSRRIKTFTEQFDTGSELSRIRNAIVTGTTLVFLGFSYHRMNMQLLQPEDRCATRRVFGSTHGLSEDKVRNVRESIGRLLGRGSLDAETDDIGGQSFDETHLVPLKCSELLYDYAMSLFIAGRR